MRIDIKGGVVQGNLGSPELDDYINNISYADGYMSVDITLFFLLSIIYNLISSHLLRTKSIPVKIGIIRPSIANVHSK